MSQRIETRRYVQEDLAAGAPIGLDSGRAHYLRSVLRLDSGARVALFNGRDGAWLARIEGLGKGWASVLVEEQLTPQRPEADIWLCFAPIKRARLDFLAEKASELGAAKLQPVMTERTVVSRVNRHRLAANAREAAEQSERLSLPEVTEPVSLTALLQDWPADRPLLYCAEAGEAAPLAEVLRGYAESPVPPRHAILTGPEGGFSESERKLLTAREYAIPVGLGPRILRADTTGIAALATWQALLGDGKERPPESRAVAGRVAFDPAGNEND